MKKILLFFLFIGGTVFGVVPDKNIWPKKVLLKADVVFEKKLPSGFMKLTAKAGQQVDLVDVTESDLLVNYNGTEGRIGIADTDFIDQCQVNQDNIDAEETRQAKIAREKKEAEDQKKSAEEAEKIQRDNEIKKVTDAVPAFKFDPLLQKFTSPKNLQAFVNGYFRDPDSFKLRECKLARIVEYKNKICWEVTWVYGARNGFGGYNAGLIKFYVLDDKIIDCEVLK